MCVYIYIYMYIHLYMYMCIYIYIYIHVPPSETCQPADRPAGLGLLLIAVHDHVITIDSSSCTV